MVAALDCQSRSWSSNLPLSAMGFWNNKASSGSDMGTDIVYSFIKAFALALIVATGLGCLAMWLLL